MGADAKDALPPGFLDLGNGELLGGGTAADMLAAADWLARNYPEHSQDPPTGCTGSILNMGIRMVVEVLDCYHGPDAKKLWLLAFAEKANDQTREGWPGRETLARRTGRSQARVSNIATELVEDGVLKRTGGGGRHRGETRYTLLPMSVTDDDQGSARANPDTDDQGSARANPKVEVKGSESASQGSARANYQGSDVSPSPAETPHIPQDPHINQPSSLSHVPVSVADGERANARGERDDDVIEGKITTAPAGATPLAGRIVAAVGCTAEDAQAFIEHMRRKPRVHSATALLNTAIGNGTIVDLYAEEAASAAAMAELFTTVRTAPPPAAPEPRPPVQVAEPQEQARPIDVTCPECGAGPLAYCKGSGWHAGRLKAAAAAQAEAAAS